MDMMKGVKALSKKVLNLLGLYDFSKIIFALKVLKGEYTYQTNVFGQDWKKYLALGTAELDLLNLTKDLDSKSKELAYLIVERFQNVLSMYPVLISSKFFTEEEIQEQNRLKKELRLVSKKYGFSDKYISVGPLCNDSGLLYLPKDIQEGLEKKIFIDGGAYVGQASVPFLKYKPSKIYCFEPVTKNHKVLLEHIRRNRVEGVIIPVQKAIGNEVGTCSISIQGNSSSIERVPQGCEVEVINIETIDNFVEKNDLSNIGLIKLDVEGFEMNVISGALQTIRRFKPVLIISIYHKPEDFFKIKPFLQEKFPDYTFIIRKSNPFWFTYDTLLMGYVN